MVRNVALLDKEVCKPLSSGLIAPLSNSPSPHGITGSYSVSESPLFTPIHLHSGLVWKVEAPEDSSPPGQKTRKESWVSPVD